MRRLRSSLVLLAACGSSKPHAQPTCNADAVIVLRGDDDVEAAEGCLTIQSLTIQTGAKLDLSPLHKLHVILGTLHVGPSVGMEHLQLSELHSVGTLEVTSNQDLRTITFPKLVSAKSISIEGNPSLVTIGMPSLANAGDISIAGLADLEHVDFDALATAGELRVTDNPKLTLFDAPKLESAKAVHVENNPTLAPEVVEALRAHVAK